MIQILHVSVPDYTIALEPDHKFIGKIIDDVIRYNFADKTIIVRGISSQAHPGMSLDRLIQTIVQNGTDRYNSHQSGDRYENIQNKHIDLFAFRRKVTPRMKLFKDISWGFYHGAKEIHGRPVRIDLLLIYDATQMKAVVHQYAGRTDVKRDGYVFRNPDDKAGALLGIVKIN